MKKNKINLIMLYLIVSLTFLIPLNIGFVNGAETYTAGQAASLCGGGLSFDNSLILSILSLCLPGIIKKTMEYKVMGCELVKCKYDHIMMGKTDVSKCENEYSYKQCTYIFGEIFALPPLAMVEFFRNIIKNILANPLGLAYSLTVLAARKVIKTCVATSSCNQPWLKPSAILLTVNDILATIQTLKDIFENAKGLLDFTDSDNACDDMQKIKKEMQKILDALN